MYREFNKNHFYRTLPRAGGGNSRGTTTVVEEQYECNLGGVPRLAGLARGRIILAVARGGGRDAGERVEQRPLGFLRPVR